MVASRLFNFCFKSLICFLYLVGVIVGALGDTEKPISERFFFDGVISIGELVTFGFLVSVHDQIHDLSTSSSLDDIKGRFLVDAIVVGVTHIESTGTEAFVGVVFKTSD